MTYPHDMTQDFQATDFQADTSFDPASFGVPGPTPQGQSQGQTNDLLSQFDVDFQTTKPAESNDGLPDGNYQMRVERLFIRPPKQQTYPPKPPTIGILFRVVDGPCVRRTLPHTLFFPESKMAQDDRAKRMSYLLRDLKNLGVDMEHRPATGEVKLPQCRASEIPERFSTAIGNVVAVTLKTKNDANGTPRQNCYINKLVHRLSDAERQQHEMATAGAELSGDAPIGDQIPY